MTEEQVLRQLAPGITDSDVFVCGPPKWNDLVRDTLKSVGVARQDSHLENYSW